MAVQNNDKRPALKPVANMGAVPQKTEPHDDDLEKIMSQIDDLQKDMSVSANSKPAPTEPTETIPPSIQTNATLEKGPEAETKSQVTATKETDFVAEFEASILDDSISEQSEPWLEETLAQLKTSETNDSNGVLAEVSEISQISHKEEEENQEMSEVEEGSETEEYQNGQLSMAIQGKMKIKLSYGSGQFVEIDFNGSTLKIQLANGMEMKIPAETKISKKAA